MRSVGRPPQNHEMMTNRLILAAMHLCCTKPLRWCPTNRCLFEPRCRTLSTPLKAKRRKQEEVQADIKLIEQQLNELSSTFIDFDNLPPLPEEESTLQPATAPEDSDIDDKNQKESRVTEDHVKEEIVFSITRFKERSDPSFFSDNRFEDVGLSSELQAAMTSIDIDRPSQIQGLTLEAFREYGFRRSLLITDQAGSGKTLAYLLPLVQKLRYQETEAGKKLTTPYEPRSLIVVPTIELAVQVLDLCRSIAKTCPFRSVAFTGSRPWKTQIDFLKEGVDVIVCTPNRLLSHLKDSMKLDSCQTIVLDEVDILLGVLDRTSHWTELVLGNDSDFSSICLEMLQHVKEGTQFLLATATLPEHTYDQLSETFRDWTFVVGPGLHRTAPGVTEQLVDCSGGDVINEQTGQERKTKATLHLISEQTGRHQRTVIFCNKIETCRKVENTLKRKDKDSSEIVVLPYHSAIEPRIRKQNLKRFLSQNDSRHLILVATDRASRGLDTSNVSHVILFDFPRDPSEYVRRVGRTARGAEGQGVVSVLVLGRQVSQARRVLNRSKKGMPIHDVPM